MKGRKLLVGVVMLLSATYAKSQKVSISGQVRPRTEWRQGYKSLVTGSDQYALFTDQRSRLNFNFSNDKLSTKITLQDVRVWGSQSQLVANDGALTTLHEAWGEAVLSEKLTLRLGRSELAYDDDRILGSVGWAQQARSHDLALFKYQDSTLTAHVGIAFNQDAAQLTTTLYTVAKSYKAMQYAWVHKDFSSNSGVSFLFLNNGKQVVDGTDEYINYSQTIGARYTYKKDGLNVALAPYFQSGTDGDANDTKISAYDVRLDLGYKVNDKVTARGGVELLSGNNQVDPSDKNQAFNPLYGTNHKFNGFMDYFYVGNHIGSVGLNDVFFGAASKVGKVDLALDAHIFSAGNDILDQTEFAASGNSQAANSYLGTELDVSFGFPLNDAVKAKGGYSVLLASESMEFLKNGDAESFQNWGYLMIIFNPKFL